jgi:hypothetical protein
LRLIKFYPLSFLLRLRSLWAPSSRFYFRFHRWNAAHIIDVRHKSPSADDGNSPANTQYGEKRRAVPFNSARDFGQKRVAQVSAAMPTIFAVQELIRCHGCECNSQRGKWRDKNFFKFVARTKVGGFKENYSA